MEAKPKVARKTDTLAWAIVVGFFAMMGMLYFIEIPEGSQSAVNLMCGALMGAFGTVVGYKWGSSEGSATKTELMATKQEPES